MSEKTRAGRRRLRALLHRLSWPFRGTWPRLSEAVVGIFALGLVGFVLVLRSPTLAHRASDVFAQNKYVALVDGLLNPFRTHRVLLNSGLPVYDLKITRREYARVEEAIEKAKKKGWMDDELKVWANAKFYHEGQSYNVKARVRGDLGNHWRGRKKSWRIKFGRQTFQDGEREVREPVYFEGKRQINLIIPSDRDYVLGPFINSLLRDQGFVVPRDGFAVLRINGSMQGLYYEVEHFDKPLLAAHRRPETPVFGQSDRALHFEKYTKLGAANAADTRFDIGSVRQLVNREDDLGLRAMQVLIDHSLDPTQEKFRRARAVLDWEKYLRFRVFTTLCNTNHLRFGSDNFRLYFDASRGLLEPVPWDFHITRLPGEPGTVDYWNDHGPDEIQKGTLMDPKIRLQRNRILWELVADGGDRLLERFDSFHDRIRPLAWADVLATPIHGYKMDRIRADLRFNVQRVHKVLSLSSANVTYRQDAPRKVTLEIAATNFSGVHVEGLEISDPLLFTGRYDLYLDRNDNGEMDAGDPLVTSSEASEGRIRLALDEDVLPDVGYRGENIHSGYWEFFDTYAGRRRYFLIGKLAPEKVHPLHWAAPRIEVSATNVVSGVSIPSALIDPRGDLPDDSIGITAWNASDPFDLEAPEQGLEEFLAGNPQFRRNPARDDAVELAGTVSLSGTTIVPRGVHLTLRSGTDLAMASGASLLAYGGLSVSGSAKEPIRVRPAVPGRPWGALAVVRPPEKVTVRHLELSGGGQARINGMLFTGGFAVHDGDLDIEESHVHSMQSEDGINLKNGRIRMRNCLIESGASDGMDLDFVTGEVRRTTFRNNAGDGLDISGSEVLVVGNRFEGMGDKGISVGENSHPIIVDSLIRGNQIGISTKDLSVARVAHSTFVDNVLAIEAKRKKPMFGPGAGEFVNNAFSGNRELLEEDHFSRGLVKLESSVLDGRSRDCPNCENAPVRFVSSETGDYRLAPSAGSTPSLRMSQASWVQDGLRDGGTSSLRPGVLSDLRGHPWAEERSDAQ